MEKNNDKPKLRFPGFTDPWEQRKLGELCDVYDGTHQTPNYQNSGIMFLSVENINSLKSEKFISEEDFIKDFNIFPEKDDVLMTRIGDIGTVNVVESNEPKAYYVSLALLKKKSLDPYFLKESISSETVKNDLWKRTLHIAFPKKINKNEIAEVLVPYPEKREEQEQIGMFFKNFDDLITLHQRKLNHLRDKKKGLLQKMFPKNGENFPELRFPGFTDSWEQRKLGDFIIDYVEKTTEQNQYPVLTSSQQQGIVLQEEYFANRQVTTENNIGYFVLPSGYFTFRSRSDNDVFVFNRNDIIDKGIISYFYPVFTLKGVDSDFFLRRINNGIQRQISIAAEGTGQHVLSLKKFKNITAMFPSLEEQKCIGEFFKDLDTLVTLHQRKLNHLQKQKKALLQQMFV